jgi:hypothetical protein
MADTKITALTAITTVDPAVDVLPIVDVSDTTMAASGTTKKITSNQILGAGGTATLASATITGDLTVDTSTLKVDSANYRVGIGRASPAYVLDIADAAFSTRVAATNTNNSAAGAGLYLRTLSSGSLVSNATFATANDGTCNLFTGTTTESLKMSIGPTGIFTWQNVGGVAGTAMTLNSTGLGVGALPLGVLAGRGNVTINGSTDAILALGNAGVLAGYIAQSTSKLDIVSLGATFVRILTNGSERYKIDSTGVATWSNVGGVAGTAMTLDSTGLLVGTTSANGSASNSVKNVGGVFSTVNGATGSIATGVAATLFTAPSEAVFIVSAYIVGSASPANYNAVAIVRVSGGTAAITTISTASNLTISLSGLNVQATQTSGINQAFAYSAIRIS